jgi:hypothetical protein
MATKARNGNVSLDAAMTMLIQNQAQFITHLTETRKDFAEMKGELDQIKTLLLQHDQILKNHEQILKDLPEAIRQKIGFKKN